MTYEATIFPGGPGGWWTGEQCLSSNWVTPTCPSCGCAPYTEAKHWRLIGESVCSDCFSAWVLSKLWRLNRDAVREMDRVLFAINGPSYSRTPPPDPTVGDRTRG